MSDFPEKGSYSTKISGCHIGKLKFGRAGSYYPIVIKRGKDQYLYDIDGNKYVDFYLNNGSVIAGHSCKHLTTMVKNAVSYGVSWTGYNKFDIKLDQLFKELTPFKHFAFYPSELHAMVYLLKLTGTKTIGVNTDFLYSRFYNYFPGLDISKIDESKNYDLIIAEPLDFDYDLSEVDYRSFKCRMICSYESRAAFRIRPGFVKTPEDGQFILSSFNISNGTDSAVLMSESELTGYPMNVYLTSLILETIKYYRNNLDFKKICKVNESQFIQYKSASIFKIIKNINSEELLKFGIYFKGSTGYLCHLHSSYDLERLYRGISAVTEG